MGFLSALHNLAAIVFLGDIIVSLFWKSMSDRTRDARILRFSQRVLVLSDRALLMPAVALMLITGFAYAYLGQVPIWSDPKLAAAQVCFIIASVIWRGKLVGLQRQQLQIVETMDPEAEIPERFWSLNRRWLAWGTAGLVLLVISLALMSLY
jgi:uncharacterized membrane protein